LALAALFLSGSPPAWVHGAGLGAGAAVAAVAVRTGLGVATPIWQRASGVGRARVLAYGLAGAIAAALAGPWLVLVLLACGVVEVARRRLAADGSWPGAQALWLLTANSDPGGTLALAWSALKVGALAFGGGFVIVPLMQADAVGTYHWMTHGQFLNAVALGQVTPGPVVLTVAVVGYSAGGLADGLLAALIAFAPSFSFILIGARRFERLLGDERALAFLAGAGPAAAGAIVGAAVPLTGALGTGWQYAVLAAAALALLVLRRGIVITLVAAGCAGAAAALLGAPIPR